MSELKFPCLMEYIGVGNRFIVEFTSVKSGRVIVKGDTSYNVGDYQDIWINCTDSSYWKPYIKQPENKPMNTSTKQQALLRLEAIETEQKELRKLLEAPSGEVAVESLLYESDNSSIGSNDVFSADFDLSFQTPQLADKYAAAFETFIKLRQCVGTVAAKGGVEQFIIFISGDVLITDYQRGNYYKVSNLSPCFSTREYAEAAIKTVGEFEIIQMFKTFSHYED